MRVAKLNGKTSRSLLGIGLFFIAISAAIPIPEATEPDIQWKVAKHSQVTSESSELTGTSCEARG